MGDGHSVTGTTYALTVFTAVLPGHESDVLEYVEGLPRGEEAPIARLGIVHTSRLQLIDQLVYQGEPQRRDSLNNAYLVFTAAFDGKELDPFLDALADRVPEAHEWWRHCVGYPGMEERDAFKRWIRHNKIDTSLFGVAYPNESVEAINEALALRERLVGFAIDAQGLDAAELQDRFRRTFAEEIHG